MNTKLIAGEGYTETELRDLGYRLACLLNGHYVFADMYAEGHLFDRINSEVYIAK